jgi:hypothetical protein
MNTHHIQCEAYGKEETELLATIFTSQSTNVCLQMRRQSISLQLNICKFLDVRKVSVLMPPLWWDTQKRTVVLC